MAPKEMITELYDEPSHQLQQQQQPQPLARKCASPTCSPLRKKPATAPLAADKPTTALNNSKKRVRWATITIHEFGVGLGGSSVPTKGGPAIGLADTPEFTWTTKVGQMAERSEGVHRFTPEERVRLLQAAGESDGMILRFSRETNIILASRRRTLVEDLDNQKKKSQGQKKRKAEREHPSSPSCASFLGQRPRMIPASYV